MSRVLPVTVVTGFLGAGKTTLVSRWLERAAPGELAVIVNEHAALGIDGELLRERARVLTEITGGCICCTTQAELVKALDDLACSPERPQRILIETSGAASPAGVLRAITRGGRSGALYLDGVVTVFDATRVDARMGEDLAREQLGFADVVVLSRCDLCADELAEQAASVLAARNGAAAIARAVRGDVVAPSAPALTDVLALRSAEPRAPRLTRTFARDHVYESVSLEHLGALDAERFADFVERDVARFAGQLFRIKAILAVEGLSERMIVQGVADEVEITFGQPWGEAPRRSRMVVVGFGLDRDALRRGFDACALPEPSKES